MAALVRLPTMARLWLFAACAAASLSGCKQPSADDGTSASLQMASDYVMAACLIQRYAGSPLAEEAEVWAAGLIEQGDLPVEAYARLAELVKLAPEPGESSNGTVMRMSSCMSLYNSPELKSRVRDIVSRKE